MDILEVHGAAGVSKILVGEKIENVGRLLPGGRVFIITDENVKRLHADKFPEGDVITIGLGEKIKTLGTVEYIYSELIRLGADRASFILGIGGGIVTDITGFVASTYMRGVRFGFVATTLLSQVDASVGGKNGVNLGGFKNMIGVFNQPEFVICDLEMLKTLPMNEILCGFGEIIKHALIEDAAMFDYLGENHEKAKQLDLEVIGKLVYESVVIKARVVDRDERESGERRKLNFGHTVGHGLEKLTGMPHGAAVAAGMAAAAEISVKRGLLPPRDLERIKALIKTYGLPVAATVDRDALISAITKDKKKEQDSLFFVLLKQIGESVVEKISLDEVTHYL